MNVFDFFKKNAIHFGVLAVFIIVTAAYFSPQFNDYALSQDDIERAKGMTSEIVYHREVKGEEPLWTNAMFGGMPTTQISVVYSYNIASEIKSFFLRMLPPPAGQVLLHLLCFYIMALFLRIKPLIGMLGAFAFAFASYEIVILSAGHNTKAIAVAFMPAVVGAFVYAFRDNWKWGALWSSLFLALELSANHLQVTYYLAFLLFGLGVYFLVGAIREKKWKPFAFSTGAVIAGYILAIVMNYGNISMTNSYVKHTMRGDNDLTIKADGTPLGSGQEGLEIDYITNWSYGKSESLTLISPYVKGSHSGSFMNSPFQEMVEEMEENGDLDRSEFQLSQMAGMYWGDQPGTSGPVYLGVVVVFLALLALFFVKDRSVWVLFGVSVLALFFAWGKNLMWFTEFLVEYMPMYNKFRTVTIAMVMLELCIPLMGVLALQKLYVNRESIKEKKKLFLMVAGGFVIFLLGMKIMTPSRYMPSGEMGQQQIDSYVARDYQRLVMIERSNPGYLQSAYEINPQDQGAIVSVAKSEAEVAFDGMKKIRRELYSKSTTRSLLIGLVAVGLCALFFFTSLNSMLITGALAALVLIDMIPVNRVYLSDATDDNDNYLNWIPREEKLYPVVAMGADYSILAMETDADEKLKSAVAEGENLGKEVAERDDITGDYRKRVIDFYKFQAMAAASNYRVYDRAWTNTHDSYFHKSLGGYSAAKLRRIQNLYDFHIQFDNPQVYNMMNVKYFTGGQEAQVNPDAMGNAWAVKKVETYENGDQEIRALGKKFKMEKLGDGTILMNKEIVQDAKIYGTENLKYVTKSGDSIGIPDLFDIDLGMKAIVVHDTNGRSGLVPEITLQMDSTNAFKPIASIECIENFNAEDVAVMNKEEASKLSKKSYSGEATVKMTSYDPKKISYDVNSKGKQLIVFSEIYYPDGWKAYVDGKEQEILRVNYLLRGLELENGNHKIEFVYDVPAFKRSNTLALIASIVLLLGFAYLLFVEYKKRKVA